MTHSAVTIKVNSPPPYFFLSKNDKIPTVMTVAGSDSSGGAGIEADLKTITAHKCYAMSCITSLTVQTPVAVSSIIPTPREVVSQILDANLMDMRCDVIKTGLLTEDSIEALSSKLQELESRKPLLVVDPVMVATSGSALANESVVDNLIQKITPLATLITPNIPECFKLLGKKKELNSMEDVYELAKELSKVTKCKNILIKGGHNTKENESSDILKDVLYKADENKFFVYHGVYHKTRNTHGTGCTLASAIASNLSRRYSIEESVYGAIEFVQTAIGVGCDVAADHITENGPINHLYTIETPLAISTKDECFSGHDIFRKNKEETIVSDDFFTFLINHPDVSTAWKNYTNHNFVKEITEGKLKPSCFKHFVEQDYSYLVDYAKIHCIAASKASHASDIENEMEIVGNVKMELTNHENTLKEKFGVKDEVYFDNIKKSSALKAYSRYFYDVARRGNWEELIVSLSPCLMGYGYALMNFENIHKSNKSNPYYEWCETYCSDRYRDAMKSGQELLNRVAKNYPKKDIGKLIKIYKDVCELEIEFWSSALNYEN